MARSTPSAPLITVIGATGTGKSDLAVALARRYNGEVINGDAMQLYEGLPVITNKITEDEKEGIPHHLLACIGMGESTWVVGTFVKRALGAIEEIRSRGKLPILVGGTHYYTQSLLFQERLAAENTSNSPAEKDENASSTAQNIEDQFPMLGESTENLLAELRKVDPVMADRWHPNDRRKIQRSLTIYWQVGRKASDIYKEQRQVTAMQNGENKDPTSAETGMRSSSLVFWIHAERDVLRSRLDSRVDKMLERGLLDEVRSLNRYADEEKSKGRPVDESRGIWVSIGYKEFKEYVAALEGGGTTEADLDRLKEDAAEKTRIATRQYAKRQLQWIRIKLVNALASANASQSLFLLDGSDINDIPKKVAQEALELTQAFLSGSPMPEPASLSAVAKEQLTPKRDYDYAATPQKWVRQHCDHCSVTCVTEKQWEQHARSRAHRRLVSKWRKQNEQKVSAHPRDEDNNEIPEQSGSGSIQNT